MRARIIQYVNQQKSRAILGVKNVAVARPALSIMLAVVIFHPLSLIRPDCGNEVHVTQVVSRIRANVMAKQAMFLTHRPP
jgi:hypothetical protein